MTRKAIEYHSELNKKRSEKAADIMSKLDGLKLPELGSEIGSIIQKARRYGRKPIQFATLQTVYHAICMTNGMHAELKKELSKI